MRQIADAIAGTMVRQGQAVGVGVAIVDGHRKAKYFSYGDAVAKTPLSPAERFRVSSIFRIGSVSKVFTTNLLGQRMRAGAIKLTEPLSDFQAQTGKFPSLTSSMTIGQLATFTGGVIDKAPECAIHNPVPGCLPVPYPTLQQYPVQDLVEYFQNATLKNYQASPPTPITSLPAPWFYSNYSMALMGLLLGSDPDSALDNSAVKGWFKAVKRAILDPLGLGDTTLYLRKADEERQAHGYLQATADATVTGDTVSSIALTNGGGGYTPSSQLVVGGSSIVPHVRIVGGGGTGAKATASVGSDGRISGIGLTNGGSGYIPPPVMVFTNGGGTKPPVAKAHIANGKVIGVDILYGGEGLQAVPTANIKGGQPNGGDFAAFETVVAGGQVVFVRVTNPGSGYVDPIAVVISPGAPTEFPVTASAPSGFLRSTLKDMAAFGRAALARKELSGKAEKVRLGFKTSERERVCTIGAPSLSSCPATTTRGGLAWMIHPGNAATGYPTVISKDGGVPGFSTFVTLMPKRNLVVVVFVNSVAGGGAPAVGIGSDILDAVYYSCPKVGSCR